MTATPNPIPALVLISFQRSRLSVSFYELFVALLVEIFRTGNSMSIYQVSQFGVHISQYPFALHSGTSTLNSRVIEI